MNCIMKQFATATKLQRDERKCAEIHKSVSR